jgi:hypothetical protein
MAISAFAQPKPANDKLSPMAQLKQVNITLQEENHRLKQREDGDRFKPTDTAQDIATVLVGMFSPSKAKDIAERILAKLSSRTPGEHPAPKRATRAKVTRP